MGATKIYFMILPEFLWILNSNFSSNLKEKYDEMNKLYMRCQRFVLFISFKILWTVNCKKPKMPNFCSIFVCARPSRFCVMCTSAYVCPQIFPWKTMLSKVFEPRNSTGCFLYIDGYIKDTNCRVLSGAHTKAESV